jgi:hypothetical protein
MASHSINQLPSGLELREVAERPAVRDRRSRTRAEVHWPVSFSLPGTTEIVRTVTRDLSSAGFYCILNASFIPGESRDCTLAVPTNQPHNGLRALVVRCQVRVVRVELSAESGSSGVGCQIIDYRLV